MGSIGVYVNGEGGEGRGREGRAGEIQRTCFSLGAHSAAAVAFSRCSATERSKASRSGVPGMAPAASTEANALDMCVCVCMCMCVEPAG